VARSSSTPSGKYNKLHPYEWSPVLTLQTSSQPLSYKVTTTQGTSVNEIYDGRDQVGHYNATCYVDVKDVAGAPNTDIAEWFNAPRTQYYPQGKIDV